jgi:hypothetical protein
MERAADERHHVFHQMSANVLKAPYKDQYINVYQKKDLIDVWISLSEKQYEEEF